MLRSATAGDFFARRASTNKRAAAKARFAKTVIIPRSRELPRRRLRPLRTALLAALLVALVATLFAIPQPRAATLAAVAPLGGHAAELLTDARAALRSAAVRVELGLLR